MAWLGAKLAPKSVILQFTARDNHAFEVYISPIRFEIAKEQERYHLLASPAQGSVSPWNAVQSWWYSQRHPIYEEFSPGDLPYDPYAHSDLNDQTLDNSPAQAGLGFDKRCHERYILCSWNLHRMQNYSEPSDVCLASKSAVFSMNGHFTCQICFHLPYLHSQQLRVPFRIFLRGG